MNMDALKKQLIRHEGFVPHAYQDHLGFWTIGIGRLIDKRKFGGITREEAEYLLENDIAKVLFGLRKRLVFWDNLTPIRQQALVNMGFQLGVDGVLNFRKMLLAMSIAHYDLAADEALKSRWARQTPDRAAEISEMIRAG